MKVIDLLNKIANGENVPNRILVVGEEYEFDFMKFFYRNIKTETDLLEDGGKEYITSEFLNFYVTEIEEEQDKIDIQNMKRIDTNNLILNGIELEEISVLNELIKAVKQLDTEIKEINNAR